VFHDKTQCPIPRTRTFQTLEDFYAQDFLQTFTDCLKSSDFSTRGAMAMGFSLSEFFEGSSVTELGERVTASLLGASVEFPYECCVQPSFYVANVRGLEKSTPYYNPLFTTVHDFNCFVKDGCVAGGSLRNSTQQTTYLETNPPFDFPKSSPRSVMWYMQNSIANVHPDHVSGGIQFWQNGEVGNISAVGGTLDLGIFQGSSGVNQHAEQLGGNAALFSAIKKAYGATDTPSQAAQVTYGVFSCPTTNGSSATPNETWNTSLMYPIPNTWAQTASPDELDCCTRGVVQGVEGGQGIVPKNLSSFLANAESQTQAIAYAPVPQNPITCSNYHCFESPYCQSLLARACKDFSTSSANQAPDFQYGGYCTLWRNWASNNYVSIDPSVPGRAASKYPNNSSVVNPPPSLNLGNGAPYPYGAFSSSVDQSVFTLLAACSSTNFSIPQPQEIIDQCNGLLSVTSNQTNFPRLKPITFDTSIQYSYTPITPFTVDPSNNQIDILFTYSKYIYVQNTNRDWGFINGIINRGLNQGTTVSGNAYDVTALQPFIVIPQIEYLVSLTTIYLDNIVATTSASFYEKVRANFNLKLQNFSFASVLPPPNPVLSSVSVPLAPFNYISRGNVTPWPNPVNAFSLSTAQIDYSNDKLSWVDNSITIVHNLVNQSEYLASVTNMDGPRNNSVDQDNYSRRLENLTYLYNPLGVIWSSALDYYNVPDASDIRTRNPTKFNAYCQYIENGSEVNVPCYSLGILQQVQNIVLDQNGAIVDVTNPANLLRVDDRLTVVFNPRLAEFLALDRQGNSVTVNLNPLRGPNPIFQSISDSGAPQSIPQTGGAPVTFTTPFIVQNPTNPIPIFNLINTSVFWLTNTTPIPIYSLSALNYSGSNTYIITFDPISNPSTPLLPGSSVSIRIVDPSDPDNTGSYSATPVLFFDASTQGWQNNFNSPDFPVLGGVLSSRGIDISTVFNSYGYGERFSSYTADAPNPDFQGTISTILTYYKNQNVYTTGEANSGGAAAISQMFLAPLI
jgi:hypothetical protein